MYQVIRPPDRLIIRYPENRTMPSLFNQVKRLTVAETIVEQVKQLIVQGQLTSGQKLPSERELAEELGVGRSSVREATSALVALGIAEVRQGEGVFIRPDFPKSILDNVDWTSLMIRGQVNDLIETRLAIELSIVRLATQRASETAKTHLYELAYEMDASMEIDRFIQLDLRFHLTLASASQNIVMHSVIHGIQQLMKSSMLQVLQNDNMREIATQQHRVIATAIRDCDEEAAVLAMQEHLMKDARFLKNRTSLN